MKIPPALEELLEEGIIDDVHRQLLSGKEAAVYVVSRDEMLIAAKVYKARNHRTFKNVTSYVDGRNQTRNTRDKRAKHKKTKYGRELLEESWRSMEHDALQRAFQGGVRVPEPYLLTGDVLLMEFLCDEAGEVAPRLADIDVPFEVAGLLHQEVYQQTKRLLATGLIHGDLSSFNVLVAPAGLTLIDLPQVVDASVNSEAKELLCRDLRNITDFFARYDARLLEFVDCGEPLWEHYKRGTLDRAESPEKMRKNPKSGRGRRGRAGDGGLGARAEKKPGRKPAPSEGRGGERNNSRRPRGADNAKSESARRRPSAAESDANQNQPRQSRQRRPKGDQPASEPNRAQGQRSDRGSQNRDGEQPRRGNRPSENRRPPSNQGGPRPRNDGQQNRPPRAPRPSPPPSSSGPREEAPGEGAASDAPATKRPRRRRRRRPPGDAPRED